MACLRPYGASQQKIFKAFKSDGIEKVNDFQSWILEENLARGYETSSPEYPLASRCNRIFLRHTGQSKVSDKSSSSGILMNVLQKGQMMLFLFFMYS